MKNFTFEYSIKQTPGTSSNNELFISGLAIKPTKFQGAACFILVQVGIIN
jgi:hypothetical protein